MTTETRKAQLREAQRRWREAHPEENGDRSKGYRAQYRATHKDAISKGEIRRKYGLTEKDFEALKKAQANRCAICDEEVPLNVDHDHQTGRVRGLLCRLCNWGLGQFRDDLELLQKAAAYLGR